MLPNYLSFCDVRSERRNSMSMPKTGQGFIIGKNVQIGKDVVIWNYVVIGDNVKIGDGTKIGSFVDIGKDAVIGKNCIIQAHVTISNECRLSDHVFIGPNSSLLNDRFPHSGFLSPSIIEAGAVIGGCVTILPNVTIGKDCIVAAGSVVTKDVPAKTVVKGVPAKQMMTRAEYDIKKHEFIEDAKRT